MNRRHITVHSHGMGVQSCTIRHLYTGGKWPKPDLAIFADTQAEPEHVYEVLQRERHECERAGVELVTVTKGDLSATDRWGGLYIPAFTLNHRGDEGMLRRQCTHEFKVTPIRRELRRRGATKVELWLGISTDEIARAKPAGVQWTTHRWPLLELGMSREDCRALLERNEIDAGRSACVFCPYHSDREWLDIKRNPRDWQAAVEYDRQVRDKRSKGGDVFVHRDRIPLEQVTFADPDMQPGLWDEECTGGCGL